MRIDRRNFWIPIINIWCRLRMFNMWEHYGIAFGLDFQLKSLKFDHFLWNFSWIGCSKIIISVPEEDISYEEKSSRLLKVLGLASKWPCCRARTFSIMIKVLGIIEFLTVLGTFSWSKTKLCGFGTVYRVIHELLDTQFRQPRMRECAAGCLFNPLCRRERWKSSAASH